MPRYAATPRPKRIDSRQDAPRFTAKTLEGEKPNNDSLVGKPVLVQFWTTWCGVCRRDQESINEIAEEFRAKGLVVLAVNVGESRRKVKEYLASNRRVCKVVLTEDTNLAAVWEARAFPLYVAIDAAGKVAGTQEGSSEAGLRRLLARVGLG